jgi:hypothetical protein
MLSKISALPQYWSQMQFLYKVNLLHLLLWVVLWLVVGLSFTRATLATLAAFVVLRVR